MNLEAVSAQDLRQLLSCQQGEITRLRKALEGAKVKHTIACRPGKRIMGMDVLPVEKQPDGTLTRKVNWLKQQDCYCGADEHNAAIDRALSEGEKANEGKEDGQ